MMTSLASPPWSWMKKNSSPPLSLYGQLLWCEFFYTAATNNPCFDKMESNPICVQIPWDRNPEALAKWAEGRTGFPWIDAIVTQLRQEEDPPPRSTRLFPDQRRPVDRLGGEHEGHQIDSQGDWQSGVMMYLQGDKQNSSGSHQRGYAGSSSSMMCAQQIQKGVSADGRTRHSRH